MVRIRDTVYYYILQTQNPPRVHSKFYPYQTITRTQSQSGLRELAGPDGGEQRGRRGVGRAGGRRGGPDTSVRHGLVGSAVPEG